MPQPCQSENNGIKCDKKANYNFKGQKKPILCKKHSKEGMIRIKIDTRICIHKDHIDHKDNTPRASFNFPDQKRPIYCKKHSEEGMINLNNRKNMCKGCGLKQPSYGLLGQKATHCSKCSTDDMVDLVSNLCTEVNCRKNATYGIEGHKATRCKTHATDNMCDVKNKSNLCVICLKNNIHKQASYGTGIKATHCVNHKNDNMKNIRHQNVMCKFCSVRATYGFENKQPEFCTIHKPDNAIDITSRMCSKCNKIQGVFGYTKSEVYCKNCKEPDMKNIIAKMCEKCHERQPTFNYKGVKPPRFCSGCADDEMVDVINQKCKSCGLFVVTIKPYLCSYCKPKSTVRQKTREMIVVNYLQDNGYNFIHNKSIGFVCGSYRPDVKIDAGTHIIIVEIDEDQHRRYDKNCEIARMFNILQAEGLPCIFIRYNPDAYKINGITKRLQTKTRLKFLKDTINNHINNVPKEFLTVYRLFYDSDNDTNIQWCDIDTKYKDMINAT